MKENQREFLRAKLPLERICLNIYRGDIALLSCVHAAIENISEGGVGIKILKYKKHYDRFFKMVMEGENASVMLHVKMCNTSSCQSCHRPTGKPEKKDFLCNIVNTPIRCRIAWMKNVQMGLEFKSLDELTRKRIFKSILELQAKQRRFEKDKQTQMVMNKKASGGGASPSTAAAAEPEKADDFDIPDFAVCDLYKGGKCMAKDDMDVACCGYILNCE